MLMSAWLYMHKILNQLIYIIIQQNRNIYKISIYLNIVRNFTSRWTEKNLKWLDLVKHTLNFSTREAETGGDLWVWV